MRGSGTARQKATLKRRTDGETTADVSQAGTGIHQNGENSRTKVQKVVTHSRPNRKSTKDRVAGLVISMPIKTN